MKRTAAWLLAGLLLAGAVHEATILATPRLLMWAVMQRLASLGGIGHMVHAPRADESRRQVVMPSPDLLYSYCVYDLAVGPLRVHAEVPANTYWSLSAYDARTDNFYAVNDRDAGAAEVDVLLLPADDNMPAPAVAAGVRVVRSPSRRGLLLLRTLVDRDERVTELDSARRRASCEVLPLQGAS